jgi:hypothetical protein
MRRRTQVCSINSLPAETLCGIMKAVLESIVEQDMMTTPAAEHRGLVGGLPFPHTMALVCRHWRNTVSSAPELWTRIFIVLPKKREHQTLSSQLKKAGNSSPIDVTILGADEYKNPHIDKVLPFIIPHIRRLRSLRMKDSSGSFLQAHFDALTGDAPLLQCLRLVGNGMADIPDLQPLFKLNCPAIRILHVEDNVAHVLDHQWVKDNLTHLEFMTISCGNATCPCCRPDFDPGVLNIVPRRIHCLILDEVEFDSPPSGVKIGAEKVILRESVDALTWDLIDDNCRTIIFHDCDIMPIEDTEDTPQSQRLPSSNTLEFEWCQYPHLSDRDLSQLLGNLTWNGNTVTVTNCNFYCIQALLVLMGAPVMGNSSVRWPRVTTLNFVAQDDFMMEFPIKMLKEMISNRREAVVQENPGMIDEELSMDKMNYKGVCPIMVLHVHGGPALSRKERLWFKEIVRDFVWN